MMMMLTRPMPDATGEDVTLHVMAVARSSRPCVRILSSVRRRLLHQPVRMRRWHEPEARGALPFALQVDQQCGSPSL